MAVDRAKVAAAAERSIHALRKTQPARVLCMDFDCEYSVRQQFRRRIDCDILAANPRKLALESLEAVLLLAENILTEPTNEKWRRFKINNSRVRKQIMEPKGVLQLVVDLGFREKAEDYDSFYVFCGKTCNELRVGASMIKEALVREQEKQDEEEQKQARTKAETEAQKEKIRQNFMDDRLDVRARVQRERHSGIQEKGLPRRKGAPTKGNIVTLFG